MSSHRIAEIVSRIENTVANFEKTRQESRERAQAHERFENAWRSIYDRSLPDKWQRQTAERLIVVAQLAIERNWDFYFGETLSRENLKSHFELALIVLRCACRGDLPETIGCLESMKSQIDGVQIAHSELFEICDCKQGLPLTPPLNQREMAVALGVTPDQFRFQFRAGKWRTRDGNRIHARKWWNIDSRIQVDVLRAIRIKFPTKIWSNNRPEN